MDGWVDGVVGGWGEGWMDGVEGWRMDGVVGRGGGRVGDGGVEGQPSSSCLLSGAQWSSTVNMHR